MKRLAITNVTIKEKNYLAYIALNERRDFVDFQLYPSDGASLTGSIVIGRVDHVVANISAAFVRITPEITGYLPLSELSNAVFTKKQSKNAPISEGDELLVQIEKDAVKTKAPVLTTRLTLTGRYAILTRGNTTLGVSKKIEAVKRQALTGLLIGAVTDNLEYNYGIVLRTNASKVWDEAIVSDLSELTDAYRGMLDTCTRLSAFTRLYTPVPDYLRRLQTLRDFERAMVDADASSGTVGAEYDGIYTDIPQVYEQIRAFLPYIDASRLILYNDPELSLGTLYNVPGNIEKLLSSKIWLKSGANIILEQLETLTFIDVNSAKNMKKDKKALAVNKEAAVEAARQLRLRNISGMILIDFINMDDKEQESALIACLKEELKKDVVPCQFIDITRLGLVELTRKKINKSLKEIVDVK